jgi:hypothetical protein
VWAFRDALDLIKARLDVPPDGFGLALQHIEGLLWQQAGTKRQVSVMQRQGGSVWWADMMLAAGLVYWQGHMRSMAECRGAVTACPVCCMCCSNQPHEAAAAGVWREGVPCADISTHIQQGDLVCCVFMVCWVCGVIVQLRAHHHCLVEQADVVEVSASCRTQQCSSHSPRSPTSHACGIRSSVLL